MKGHTMPDTNVNQNAGIPSFMQGRATEPKKSFFSRISSIRPTKNSFLSLLLLVLLAAAAYSLGSYIVGVDNKADQALNIAKASGQAVGALGDRVDSVECDLFEAQGKNAAQDARLTGLEAVATSAKNLATVANSRQDARVKAENQNYRKMLAYISGANPTFPLCAKSEAEIGKLLNDGIWNVEGQIQTEYNRLMSAGADQAKATTEVVKTVETKVETVTATANQALSAGTVAVKAVSMIADQPNRIFGKSVTGKTKRSISEVVAAELNK